MPNAGKPRNVDGRNLYASYDLIADGWSYVTSYLNMRAGVKTAANLVMAGASNDAGTQAVALSSWNNKPGPGWKNFHWITGWCWSWSFTRD